MKSSLFALSLCLSLGLSFNALAASHSMHSQQNHSADSAPPAVHGMVIFGHDERIYASHIPMFMVPHDWQAHFEISLETSATDANAFFKSLSQGKDIQELYTFAPKPFVLPDLLSGKIDTFSGDLFEGNFEAGGKVILKNVHVHVTKIMNVSKLQKTSPLSPQIAYLAVGSDMNFLSHKIVAPASFDQILEVKWLKKIEQNTAEFQLEKADTVQNRLKAGDLYQVRDGKLIPVALGEEADLQILGEFSCSLGPDFFKACE
jgi:hypothetical protein